MICGMDEVGRGPLAGPVVASAVVLGPGFPVEILADSKKLSEKKRLDAYEIIIEKAVSYGTGWVWPEEIDQINILKASLLAMKRAWLSMSVPVHPDLILVDGLFTPPIDTDIPMEAIVKGDDKIHEIMAASILAKVQRDKWMVDYAKIDGRYGFEKHKGYPTKAHREAVAKYGLSPIHRRSFHSSLS
ncbi:MAG: ribonuclease HII [Spirochaetia bacterium]|nr:ribonuclease HII [Spirochaetia bacterium]MBR0319270.1 ribonuclease HII [Spirochaetia bacterium]